MKRNIELAGLACRNLRGRRRSMRRLLFILMAPLLCCILGNSLVESYNSSLKNMCSRGLGRLKVMEDADGTLLEKIQDELKSIEGVGEVSRLTLPVSGIVSNMEELLGSSSININLRSNYKGTSDYKVSGRTTSLEYGEIVIPEYLYGIGTFGDYEYLSGTELIGEDLMIQTEQDIALSFKVVGTYNNINTGDFATEFFISQEQADELYGMIIKKNEEDYLEENKEFFEENPNMDDSFPTSRYIGIYIEEDYDMEEVSDQICDITGRYLDGLKFADETVLKFYDFVAKIINIFVVMLTVVCFVSTVMILSSEIKRRTREAAVYMALGYERKDVMKVFFLEKLLLSVKAAFYTFMIHLLVLFAANYYMQHFMSFYKRYIVFHTDMKKLMESCVILLGAVVLSILVTAVRLRTADVAVNIGRED